MNKVLLTGRLVRDNTIRLTNNKTEVLDNVLAVRRDYKNAKGEYDSDFINVIFFNATAKYINDYAPKGSMIEVVGKWQHRAYQDNQGNTKYVDECIVESASLLISSKPKEQVQEQTQEPVQENNPFVTYDIKDEDLPF